MQNGTIGEARTKAFLLDRFWVLERSVDIHGADFIIQRRLFHKNVLDMEPPKFGVVQAKYCGDGSVPIVLDENHIKDPDGEPRLDFFLIIHTGGENDARMFLLTCEHIIEEFEVIDGKYRSHFKKLAKAKYVVRDRKRDLDLIEGQIQCAEFRSNRIFTISHINGFDADAILPEYKEVREGRFTEIADEFKAKKQEAFDCIQVIEDIHDTLKQFASSVDPIESCYIAERFHYQFGSSVQLPELFNRDHYFAAKRLIEMRSRMLDDGIWDNYLAMRGEITDRINGYLLTAPVDTIREDTTHDIKINYDPASFLIIGLTNAVSSRDYSDFSRFLEAKEGVVSFSWKLGKQVRHGTAVMNECCIGLIMEKIHGLKYYDGEEVQCVAENIG